MTPEEAIEKFEKIKRGSIFLIHQRIEGKEVIEDYSLCDMAISALEKQIPKKVRITTSTKRCATCGRQLSGIGNIHPKRNFCQRCGQAIDWEEEE